MLLKEMSKEELLREIAFRDEVIDQLKKEIDKFRWEIIIIIITHDKTKNNSSTQTSQKSRKIAISAESELSTDQRTYAKSQEYVKYFISREIAVILQSLRSDRRVSSLEWFHASSGCCAEGESSCSHACNRSKSGIHTHQVRPHFSSYRAH